MPRNGGEELGLDALGRLTQRSGTTAMRQRLDCDTCRDFDLPCF